MQKPMEGRHKLHSGLRLWEFPDQYVIEPTDGSGASCLDISRLDGSMKLIGLLHLFCHYLLSHSFIYVSNLFPLSDQVAECNSLRVPKIRSIFGVVGMLKLLAGLSTWFSDQFLHLHLALFLVFHMDFRVILASCDRERICWLVSRPSYIQN